MRYTISPLFNSSIRLYSAVRSQSPRISSTNNRSYRRHSFRDITTINNPSQMCFCSLAKDTIPPHPLRNDSFEGVSGAHTQSVYAPERKRTANINFTLSSDPSATKKHVCTGTAFPSFSRPPPPRSLVIARSLTPQSGAIYLYVSVSRLIHYHLTASAQLFSLPGP